jgi:hypothetical protein
MGEDGPYEIELIPLAPETPPAAAGLPVLPEPIVVVTEDEEIYCPVCNYNLSGVFSGRCPECVAFFDRRSLIAAQQANAITLIPWDDPQEIRFWPRLWGTVRISLLDPERFAFAFSVRPKESKAASFFIGVVLATMVIGAAAALVFHGVGGLTGDTYAGLSDPPAFVSGVCLFVLLTIGISTLLTGVGLWIYCPHYDGQRHFRPWLSIAAYAAGHYLMAASAIPICAIIPLLIERSSEVEFVVASSSVWLACAALCICTLRAVIDWRTSEMDQGNTVLYAIVLVILATAIGSMFLGNYLGSQLMWAIRHFHSQVVYV